MDVSTELKEWAEIYLKNRDILQKTITGLEDTNGDFIMYKTSGDVVFLIRPELSDIEGVVEKAPGNTGLVLLNTKKNVDTVISNWDKLSKLKGLCIYFVNPKVNEKWLLYPYTHDQITEKVALKQGLQTLFSTIPTYTQLRTATTTIPIANPAITSFSVWCFLK